MNSIELDNREWFISGVETAVKIDALISALIKGEGVTERLQNEMSPNGYTEGEK